ncbi:MAG: ATP-dependent sacrificial sulfur transferase LarE [Treponemataceae bacterium]|nr:ATP-dependent sacrificial sulfur transferase LarE [Spirochaetales bacterium]MDY6030906.1 ATP-dependent sacrificial sulfur transferase LarE [Treponemataceae bacterium]
MDELYRKYENLKKTLKSFGRCAVAFSGGVDSTFLVKVANEVLGNSCLAITVNSSALLKTDLENSMQFCKQNNINHLVLDCDVLSIPGLSQNPPERCYICKKAYFLKIQEVAKEHEISIVIEGSNTDDDNDYRPGQKALKELNIISPLKIAGLGKSEIRLLSKELNLPTWQKESAACLISRFSYGEVLTKEKLSMVEQSEEFLRNQGFHKIRVRIHDKLARIEIAPEELSRAIQERDSITKKLCEFGFTYVTLDLEGYRMGSMNDMLGLSS